MASFAQAIRILTPFFAELPQAHLGLMQRMCQDCLRLGEAAALAPDTDLLAPLIAVFEELNSPEQP
jgi:hypothetical protein